MCFRNLQTHRSLGKLLPHRQRPIIRRFHILWVLFHTYFYHLHLCNTIFLELCFLAISFNAGITYIWNNIVYDFRKANGEGVGIQAKGDYSFVYNNLTGGVYVYKLKQVDYDGTFSYSNELSIEVKSPIQFGLTQNYPNPFNPATTIGFSIPISGNVKLAVYNLLGEHITDLVNEVKEAVWRAMQALQSGAVGPRDAWEQAVSEGESALQ